MDRYSCVLKYGDIRDLEAALNSECSLRRKLDEESGFELPSDWVVPIVRADPVYPPQAQNSGITGYVDLAFDIDDNGTPTNTRTVASVPPGVFDESANSAFSRWRYCQPGKQGMQIRLKFAM
jgi:TonB family protein